MQTRKFDELISYFNRKVAEMSIDTKYKMELLGMVTALGLAHEKELTAQPEQRWVPVWERLPKKHTKVLAVDFGDVDTAYINSEGRWMDFQGDKLKDVTAWMPLPKWEGDAE